MFPVQRSPLFLPALMGLALLGASLVAAGSAHAQGNARPQNIILFMADDLEWSDLPYFNPPAEWEDPTRPTMESQSPSRDEAALRMPDYNRLAARMLAERSENGQAKLGTYTHPETGHTYTVVPIDLNGDPGAVTTTTLVAPENFRYLEADDPGNTCAPVTDRKTFERNCQPRNDIYRNHGGLDRLVDGGVTFPLFYTSSAVCTPARSAMLTGRTHMRNGARDINDRIAVDEVTFAEYLKQGCVDPKRDRLCLVDGDLGPCPCYLGDSDACNAEGGTPGNVGEKYACYTTGLIGKWHVGSKFGFLPMQRGFDEYVGYTGENRGHLGREKLVCSAATERYCGDDNRQTVDSGRVCRADSDCDPGESCQGPGSGFFDNGLHFRGLDLRGTPENQCDFEADPLGVLRDPFCCRPKDLHKSSLALTSKFLDPQGARYFRDKGYEHFCNDEGPAHETQCVYYTRMMRDQARNYILRHATDQPFLLVVTFAAPHKPFIGPRRSLAHYKFAGAGNDKGSDAYDPVQPLGNGDRYWSLIEDLDAAIGSITGLLEYQGVCSDDREVGCTHDSQCSAGTCLNFGRCAAGTEEPCAGDSECNGSCIAGACSGGDNIGQGCSVDADCTGTCVVARCTGGTADGEACLAHSDCGGGSCGRGVCQDEPLTACADSSDCTSGACTYSVCDGGTEAGLPCVVDGDCGGGTCSAANLGVPMEENTLVMFTSDHGRAGHTPYGSPATSGRKNSVREGGIRVGLLAKGPDLGLVAGSRTGDDTLGGLVDLFPTMAEAGGFGDTLDADGRLDVDLCHPTADERTGCFAADGTDICPAGCQTNLVDGRSMIPAMQGSTAQRDYVFAQYRRGGHAVVTRQGYFDTDGAGVCGRTDHVMATRSGGGDYLVRTVRAGSCTLCTQESDCDGELCEVLGKVCLTRAEEAACTRDTFNPAICTDAVVRDMQRCDGSGGCSGDDRCVDEIVVPCRNSDPSDDATETSCRSTGWKFMEEIGKPLSLYDLISNPEEQENLSCYEEPPATGCPMSAGFELCRVSEQLRDLTRAWVDCNKNEACDAVTCEEQVTSGDGLPPVCQ